MSSASATATSSINAPGGAVSFGTPTNNLGLYIAIGVAALLGIVLLLRKGKR